MSAARSLSALRSGAIAGVAIALSFTLAEVFADALAGGRSPIHFWVFLACYYVPAFLVPSLALSVARSVAGSEASEGPETPPANARRLFFLLAFAYTAAVVNQEFLGMLPFRAPLRFACVAIAGAAAFASNAFLERWSVGLAARGQPATASVYLLLPVLLTVGSWLTIGLLRGLPVPAQALSFPPLVFGALTGGGYILARVDALLVTTTRRAAVGLGLLAVLGTVLGRSLQGPSDLRPYFKDLRQPVAPALGAARKPRPNVVLVVLDTLRAASMSCYGYERRTTPRLDAFARKAVSYANCTSAASFTVPGHASLFTGLLPSRHGAGGIEPARSAAPALDDGFTTLAEILSSEGYTTAGVVANHWFADRRTRLDQGFQYYDARPSSDYPFCRYLPLLLRLEGRLPSRVLRDPLALRFPAPYRPAEEITERAREWILERRPAGRPYFLFVNYVDTHTPYAPRGRFRSLWPGLDTSGENPPNGLSRAVLRDVLGGRRGMSREESAHLRSLYDGAASYLDHHVGELLEFLEGLGDYDDTWIIVTSDHGEALGEHGHLGHGCSLHQEILGIPLIVRYPRGIASDAPGVNEQPVHQTDVLPTILDGLGIAWEEGIDGVPLGKGRERRLAEAFCVPYLFLDYDRPGVRTALLEGDLKYIETAGAAPQLFDLEQDPLEQRDLHAVLPEAAERLRASVARWREGLPPGRRETSPGEPVPAEWRERLKGLGYLP